MILYQKLQHRFVDQFPEELEGGLLYVSTAYGSATHKCCCGCGAEIVTPLTPTDWRITYDGETVSLNPSVGNWTLPCRSHYIIDHGRVIEALPWSDEAVDAERRRDRNAKELHYGQSVITQIADETNPDQQSNIPPPPVPKSVVSSFLRAAYGSLRFWRKD